MLLYLFHFLILVTLIWIVATTKKSSVDKRFFFLGLSIRIIGAMGFGVVYVLWQGQGDTITFFNQAKELSSLAKYDFSSYLDYLFSSQYDLHKSEARDGFFTKVLSVFTLLTNNNYWLTSLYFAFLSFLPIWYFINQLVAIFPSHKWNLVIAFMVLPSPIFWTSTILKDALAFSSIILLMTYFLKINRAQLFKWFDYLLLALSFFLLWKLKYFLFGLSISVFIIIASDRYLLRNIKNLKLKILAWIGLVFVAITGISAVNPNLYFLNFPQAIYDNYILIIEQSESSKNLEFGNLKPNWNSLILCAPFSLLSGLFRPMPGEGNIYLVIHSLENLFIFLMTIITIIRIKAISQNLLIWLSVVFILILATFFPLASPNFGSLMRYKAVYLPFLFYLVSIIPFKSLLSKN